MSAFQAYAGAYEFDDGAYSWRCYATTRLHAVRKAEHAPCPQAPQGLKWIAPVQQDYEQQVACLVDESVVEFSQILLQVQRQPAAHNDPVERWRGEMARAAL